MDCSPDLAGVWILLWLKYGMVAVVCRKILRKSCQYSAVRAHGSDELLYLGQAVAPMMTRGNGSNFVELCVSRYDSSLVSY